MRCLGVGSCFYVLEFYFISRRGNWIVVESRFRRIEDDCIKFLC